MAKITSPPVAATSVGAHNDVDLTTSTPVKNQALKFNGADWVPGDTNDATEFDFEILTFADNISGVQEIGLAANDWKASAAISWTASYRNTGAQSTGTVTAAASNSSTPVAFTAPIDLGTPWTSGDNTGEPLKYPTPVVGNASHGTVTFTLNATDGVDSPSRALSYNFGNGRFWGLSTKDSGYVEADIEGLANTEVTTTRIDASLTITVTATNYFIYAYPAREGAATFIDNKTGLAFVVVGPETVGRTNLLGYVENYYVYRSNSPGLGAVDVGIS